MFKTFGKKQHLRELNKERCRKYYQRHKQELKESKKYGSLSAYKKHQEELVKSLKESLEQERKKQNPYSL